MIDLDNTLADRHAAVDAWLQAFSATHQLDAPTRAWIASLDEDGYASRFDVFDQIRSRLELRTPTAQLVADYRQRVVAHTHETPGASRCLKRLRSAGHRLAIVSNGAGSQQRAKIAHLGFGPLVDAVIISGDIGIKKPDPEIFHLAAQRAGASLDDACMIGDSPMHDIEGGYAVGVTTIWLRRSRTWSADHGRSPDHAIDTLYEVASLLT